MALTRVSPASAKEPDFWASTGETWRKPSRIRGSKVEIIVQAPAVKDRNDWRLQRSMRPPNEGGTRLEKGGAKECIVPSVGSHGPAPLPRTPQQGNYIPRVGQRT